jgi:serine/threonine-protein kinase
VIGKTLTHYTLIDRLGGGGMGVVYRARDLRLNRDVAVKVLAPAILTNESARHRFRREAMALSRLSHPNIATVHDFDCADGIDFLVMEHVEGETLQQRLGRGPLSEADATPIAMQIAEALEEAHEQGVVHRDLKPANVAITPKGRVKVLDFGLARLLQASDAADTMALTDAGSWSGTLPYMAPEQLEGKDVDGRADLYALGALFYEMLAGRRPFTAMGAGPLMNAILNERPQPIARVRPVPPRLESLVARLLEKDPARRPPTARDVIAELKGSATQAAPGAAAPPIRGLVVLPLENLSGDPEQEFFADGMTEELIADLAQIQALRVISRTSAMRYKKTTKTLQEIGRELNVEAVVEGSVRRYADRVRITAQLIEVATDRHLWAKSYERDLKDVLALQGEVARAIAQEIRVKVTPEEEARLARSHVVDPRAYESYLRGRQHWNKRNDEGLLRSLEYFREAIDLDPDWATARVGLADAYCVIGFYGTLPPGDSFPKGKIAATAALRMDDQLAEAYSALGYVQHYYEWDWAAAERSFHRALELNDGSAYIHLFYANMLAAMGRHEEAIRTVTRGHELDPLSMIIRAARAWMHFFARDLDAAVPLIEELMEREPDFSTAFLWASPIYEVRGEYDKALRVAIRGGEMTARNPWALSGMGRALAKMGRGSEAEAILAELRDLASRRYVSPYDLGLVCEALGLDDEAFAQLERCYEGRANMLVLLGVDPRWDRLRPDARFGELERRMRFPATVKAAQPARS